MTALDVLCAPLTRDLFGIAKFLSIWRMELLHAALQCGTIMTLISPGDCTVQCNMWLWNHDIEFARWQHPAVWQVGLGRHATEFAQTSAI